MIDALLEHRIGLSIAQEVRGALGETLVQVQGNRAAVGESVEEWAAVDVLSIPRVPSRRGVWVGRVLFQVACFSRLGPAREDGQTGAPWKLAAAARAGIEKRGLAVKSYDTDAATIAALSVGEASMTYLAEDGDDHVHGVIVSFRGTLTSG